MDSYELGSDGICKCILGTYLKEDGSCSTECL